MQPTTSDRQTPDNFSIGRRIKQFFVSPARSDLKAPTNISPSFVQAQERILTVMTRFGAVLGLIALLESANGLLVIDRLDILAAYAVPSIGLWILAVGRRIDYRLRAAVFLLLIYGLSLVELLNYGETIESHEYLLAFIILTTVFLGVRQGFMAMAGSLVTLGVFGWLISSGQFKPSEMASLYTTLPPLEDFVGTWLVFLMIVSAVEAGLFVLVDGLTRAWQLEHDAVQLLQQGRDLLEQHVTERTRDAEQTQAEAEAATRANNDIIETVREPLLVLDSDLRVLSANRSFYEAFKVTPQETIGNLIYDLGNRQWDIPKLRTLLEEILPKDNLFDDYEVEHEFSNIGHKIMLLNARRIAQTESGSQLILLAIEDKTEKMRLQRELTERTRDAEQAQAEAEAATKAKSEFLANMSHELRTPLNSIIGFSEVLEDELLGTLNESQRKNVMYILKAGRHLLSLINDILDLSKVEAGKMELELSQMSLKELLDSSLVMQREKALRHDIQLDLRMDPLTDRVIEADERKLKQIMFNLLSNAVKFTPDGGSVQVRTRDLAETQEIEISVEDTGIGIEPEDIPKLFKGFSQLETAYDKRYEGTGLGLALTKKFVELHGGHIEVTSEFGQGSRFAFALPQRREIKNDN